MQQPILLIAVSMYRAFGRLCQTAGVATVFIVSLTGFFASTATSEAVGAPPAAWQDPSGFNQFSLILGSGSSFGATVINGNTGYNGTQTGNLNGMTFNGPFSYATSNPITGSLGDLFLNGLPTQSSQVATAYAAASNFSTHINNFGAYPAGSSLLTITVGTNNIAGTTNINVVDITGGSASPTITITGSANETFYINVSAANYSPSMIVLSGGVTANNVFWNIENTGPLTLSGTYNCTILDFDGALNFGTSGARTVASSGLFASSVTLNNAVVMPVPEPSTWVGFGVAAAGILVIASRAKQKIPVRTEQ